MSITVDAIVDRASGILLDVGGVRYSAVDLRKYISDGQRRTVQIIPEASAVTRSVTLVADCKQTIPGDALLLIDCVRNISSGGVLGRAIRRLDRETLDREDPDWQKHKGSKTIEHWCYDPKADPRTFWIYPQPAVASIGSMMIELTLSLDPPELASGQTPSIDPKYHVGLIHYAVAMAVARDAEYADQAGVASQHMQQFMLGLGVEPPKNATR